MLVAMISMNHHGGIIIIVSELEVIIICSHKGWGPHVLRRIHGHSCFLTTKLEVSKFSNSRLHVVIGLVYEGFISTARLGGNISPNQCA